jgi:hypothetical protein
VLGTDDKQYGPQYKPKYPVPGGSQPRLWWDPHDKYWSREPGTGGPREHFDRWGNKVNAQAVARAATVVGTAVVLYRIWRVVQIIAEVAAGAAAF